MVRSKAGNQRRILPPWRSSCFVVTNNTKEFERVDGLRVENWLLADWLLAD